MKPYEPRGEEEGGSMNTLRKGDTGDAVCYLQTLLNRRQLALGLSIDGIFGPQTEGAVKDFQSDSRLVVDGIVGIKTWTALSNEAPNVMPRNKFLSESDLIEAAKTLGVELAVMKAVAEVESHGAGFIPGTDKPKILFEGHVFWKRLKVYGIDPEKHVKGNEDILYKSWTKKYYLGGEREYDRLGRATLIHGEAGNESASWGMFQIMGYHWEALGYKSAYDFADSMWKSEAEHLKAFVRYIQVNDLAKWMKVRNWTQFARLYNGPGHAANQYGEKMEKAYERYKP